MQKSLKTLKNYILVNKKNGKKLEKSTKKIKKFINLVGQNLGKLHQKLHQIIKLVEQKALKYHLQQWPLSNYIELCQKLLGQLQKTLFDCVPQKTVPPKTEAHQM